MTRPEVTGISRSRPARIWILAAAAAAMVLLGAAREAAADDPLERPCQPDVEAAVRAALPQATSVTCPVLDREYRIFNGQSVFQPVERIKADAVLRDGRTARVEVVPAEAPAQAAGEAAARAKPSVAGISYAHSDLTGSSGPGMAALFWLFAIVSVAGAIFVITRRNLIAAVMGMVGSFVGIAALYMMLYAQFLAVVQMLVYAGAIMVLFVFVVMILNRPEDEPVAPSGRAGQVLGGIGILYLILKLSVILIHVEAPDPVVARNAPQPLPDLCNEWKRDDSVPRNPGETAPQICVASERPDWGSVTAVGSDLFGPGLFPFEAISLLLLVAVVGAIAIARPLKLDDEDEAGGVDDEPRPRSEGGHA